MADLDYSIRYDSLSERLRHSALARIFGLLLLVLTLQIPLNMIDATIGERRQRRQDAIAEVTRMWAGRQTVRGPFLVIPYVLRVGENGRVRVTTGYRYVLPEVLRLSGELVTEKRRRGIFEVPLYVGQLGLTGEFRLPEAGDFPENSTVRWEQASISLAISDPKALRENVPLDWGGRTVAMLPGVGSLEHYDAGLHAPVPLGEPLNQARSIDFGLRLKLAGSDGLSVLPAGSDTTVELAATWPDPSFVGAYLPVQHEVTAESFKAKWWVPQLARSFPAAWNCGDVAKGSLDASLLGVTLLSPIDAYRTTERAVKYELLFIGLTFLAFLLFELVGGLRVHWIQYLLVGLALCLFYLLLLSLAEHVGFALAYATASSAIAVLVTAYGRAVLHSVRRTAGIAAVVVSLYVYLFVLLQIQDYALLVGSVGLFAILSAVMYLTRNVDWYTFDLAPPSPAAPESGTR